MQFSRHDYFGAPEYITKTRRWKLDVEWNTRFPGGFSATLSSFRKGVHKDGSLPAWTCCLEVNPPMGEPNRLYVSAWGWFMILGLPSLKGERMISREGRAVHTERYLTWPHLDGCSRYLHHRDEEGKWVRNDRPERGHWGWLTVYRN